MCQTLLQSPHVPHPLLGTAEAVQMQTPLELGSYREPSIMLGSSFLLLL